MSPQPRRSPAGFASDLLHSDGAWIALWSAPLWTSVFGRILKHRTPWFVDYASVLCAAERARARLPLYGPGASCPKLRMSSYVYPPWIAHGLVTPLQLLGERGLTILYATLFAPAFVFLLWAAFVRTDRGVGAVDADRRLRWAFLAFVAGSPLVVGNVAIVAQASVVAAALFAGSASILLIGVIMAASLIKPIYLTYLAVPFLAKASVARRIALIGVAGTLVGGLVMSNLPEVAAWRGFVMGEAVDPNPGGGFFRWLGDAGVSDHRLWALGYGVYAMILLASGWVIATRGELGRDARVWLGASLALLLMPRLVAYDLIILGPGLVGALTGGAGRIGPRTTRRFATLWILACAVNLLANLGGGALRLGHSLSVMALAAGLVALAAALLRAAAIQRSTTTAPVLS